ncbi:hypothetical protein LT493_17620 [Streptomyces tricolor]|nr:hypothetical protein [Streptomyces tricolor]
MGSRPARCRRHRRRHPADPDDRAAVQPLRAAGGVRLRAVAGRRRGTAVARRPSHRLGTRLRRRSPVPTGRPGRSGHGLPRKACDGDFLNGYFAGKVATVAKLHEALWGTRHRQRAGRPRRPAAAHDERLRRDGHHPRRLSPCASGPGSARARCGLTRPDSRAVLHPRAAGSST